MTALFRAARFSAPMSSPSDAMPFVFLFRGSGEMQVGGLMPDEGPAVPSRLAIYLRQCCTEGQDAIIARQVETAHRFRVTDHSRMRIMEEQGHISAPLAKSTTSGNAGGTGQFVQEEQIRILYNMPRAETGASIEAGGTHRIGVGARRRKGGGEG